jgi:hypothetical protein
LPGQAVIGGEIIHLVDTEIDLHVVAAHQVRREDADIARALPETRIGLNRQMNVFPGQAADGEFVDRDKSV